MQVENSSSCAFFQIFQKIDEINIQKIGDPNGRYDDYDYGYDHNLSKDINVKVSLKYLKNMKEFTFKEYREIKNDHNFKVELDSGVLDLIFIRSIVYSPSFNINTDTKKIVTYALKDLRVIPANKNKYEFIFKILNDMTFGYSSEEETDEVEDLNKLKFLIDCGEEVNNVAHDEYDVDDFINRTPLQFALDSELDDSVVELFIKCGGVVYNPIAEELQTRVNKIMHPIIQEFNRKLKFSPELKFALEVFHDTEGAMNVFPKELKDMILEIMSRLFFELHPDVIQKILLMSKSIQGLH